MNRRPTAARTRALELLGQGLSERDVVAQLAREGLRVSKGSVGNWKRSAGTSSSPAATSPGTPTPAQRKPKAAAGGTPADDPGAGGTAPPDADWELPGVDLVHLPAELLERLGKRYAQKIAETLAAKLVDHQLLGALLRDHERVCKALVQARPPVAQDPENDPASLEMAAIALGHVKRMIEDARRRRVAQATPPAASEPGAAA